MQGGTTPVVSAFPAIHCDSPEYLQYRPAFIVLVLVVVVGFPVALSLTLWYWNRTGRLKQTWFKQRFGIL
jgi:hypothetical protein